MFKYFAVYNLCNAEGTVGRVAVTTDLPIDTEARFYEMDELVRKINPDFPNAFVMNLIPLKG